MLFQNPVFHPGLNVTVRNGRKWADLRPGDLLDVQAADGTSVCQGRSLFTWTGAVDDIPSYYLKFEHDPQCQSREGLRSVLGEVYGAVGPEVTVVGFML